MLHVGDLVIIIYEERYICVTSIYLYIKNVTFMRDLLYLLAEPVLAGDIHIVHPMSYIFSSISHLCPG